jgi:hypothetical protein
MARPHKKKMGRPFEDVPLRKLAQSVRRDIYETLEKTQPTEPSLEARKSKKK